MTKTKTVMAFITMIFLSSGAWAIDLSPGQTFDVHVRTASFGKGKLAAVVIGGLNSPNLTINGGVLSIVCDGGFFSSSADLVFPNERGDVNTNGYKRDHVRDIKPEMLHSPYLALNYVAMKTICNHPNGDYYLRVSTVAGQEGVVLLNGKSLDPVGVERADLY